MLWPLAVSIKLKQNQGTFKKLLQATGILTDCQGN